MMTPHTTVRPFEISILNDAGIVVVKEERFIRCNEDDTPIWDHLFEVSEVVLETYGFEYPVRRNPVFEKLAAYTTHTIIATRRRFVCRAMIVAGDGSDRPDLRGALKLFKATRH
jgi:hypothetical protein